ncbi:hypothetical protein R3P38DRAFT_2808791 [Favolaschia claudopus]|uniref:Uncharacterized protein n=1 Tax=Favolaschia claudopus TaxID=2862362 RepID=A0AAV9ZG59_9AGAR
MDVKETVDQAIQQGNARVSNGNQADVGELAAHSCPLERKGNHGARSQWKHVLECTSQWSTQQYIKKYDSRQSTWSAYNRPPPFSSTSPRGVLKCTRHWSTIHEEPLIALGIARNEAFDRDYKAICLAGKSEGIEALKQGTDLNIAFERKSVVLIECIWVFSMSCTQGQALQDPHILARIRGRRLQTAGIQRDIQKD